MFFLYVLRFFNSLTWNFNSCNWSCQYFKNKQQMYIFWVYLNKSVINFFFYLKIDVNLNKKIHIKNVRRKHISKNDSFKRHFKNMLLCMGNKEKNISDKKEVKSFLLGRCFWHFIIYASHSFPSHSDSLKI